MTTAGPPTAASGRPPPTTLPKIDRSGVIPNHACAPPRADAEPGDHLVEDEQRAGAGAPVPEVVEEAGRGGDEAHVGGDRLDEDRREVVLGEGGIDRGDVVVGHDDGVGHRTGGDARRSGDPERGDATAGGDEQRVEMTVVAARELEDLGSPGGAACQPHRRHRGLGATRDQAHLLDALDARRRSPRRARPHARSARRTTCRRPPPAGPPPRCADRRARGSTRPRTGRSRRSGDPRCRPARRRAPSHEERGTADGVERADRRVDPSGDARKCPREGRRPSRRSPGGGPGHRRCHWSDSAISRAKYVRTKSAPARRIARRCSRATASPSSHPLAAAALTIAYSPLTW